MAVLLRKVMMERMDLRRRAMERERARSMLKALVLRLTGEMSMLRTRVLARKLIVSLT
jgi:hypothetical protein